MAAKWHRLGNTLQHWIGSMLYCRKITATLAGETPNKICDQDTEFFFLSKFWAAKCMNTKTAEKE
jgi:hypothetical protein